MDKIVKKPLKIDFHIHSIASKHKDVNVNDGTEDNLSILVDNLLKNEVNMVSITDHDNFDFKMYRRLKDEEEKDNCLLKVFPAVEFTVYFESFKNEGFTDDGKVLHVISIFNDEDDDKLKCIQDYIFNEGKPKYDYEGRAFKESTFNEILRCIDLDTILIAHQKNSLLSDSKQDHDANTLDKDRFDEIVFIEYFEAYEFKNIRNEPYDRKFVSSNIKDLNKMKFVTGSDCHVWSDYPCGTEDYKFTYLKCLPSFRGLVMAFTDYSRIKVGTDSFFPAGSCCDGFDLVINGLNKHIELSKGINVIIGDNSIGKSMLLHALTDYRYIEEVNSLSSHYKKYLLDKNININTLIEDKDVFIFDAQGDIRKMFQDNEMLNRDFLCEKFPENKDFELYKNYILDKTDEFLDNVESLKYYSDNKDKDYVIKVGLLLEENKCISFLNCNIEYKNVIRVINNYIVDLDSVIKKLKHLTKNNKYLSNEDINNITDNIKFYINLKEKLNVHKKKYRRLDLIIENINKSIYSMNSSLKTFYTDNDKERESSRERFYKLQEWLSKITISKISSSSLMPDFESKDIEHEERFVETSNCSYIFTHKLNIEDIDNAYFENLLLYPIDKRRWNSLDMINFETVNDLIGDINGPGKFENWRDRFKNKVTDKIAEDFLCEPIIRVDHSGQFIELSSGGSARSYFDLLSCNNNGEGIYIVDQPEDDISQLAIKDYIIKEFRAIANNHQVIIVTHNPQFVVNLDVDNVIYLSNKNNNIEFSYGALEFKDDDFDVLETVANVLDGGIDAIRERYKRYGKNL